MYFAAACSHHAEIIAKLDQLIANQAVMAEKITTMDHYSATVERAVKHIENAFHFIVHLLMDHLGIRNG